MAAGPERSGVPLSCPVCGAAGPVPYAVAPDRLMRIARGDFPLFRCRPCGCIFQHPMPDPAALSAYYPKDYWWVEDDNSASARFLSRLERGYREFVTLDHLQQVERGASGRGRSLLDIGCGSGTFLHVAGQRGFQPHGMDVSPHAVAAAREQYGLDVRLGGIGSDAWQGSAFDVITMFHVLEHLQDPAGALAFAGSLLNPRGILVAQVPNAVSWQALLFGRRWYGLDVPRHLINFTPRSVATLFRRAGFSFRLTTRFSWRDNPAALASSLAVGLDPVGRRGRGRRASAVREGLLEISYFALTLLAIPPALIESWSGHGATIWIHAWRE